MVSSLLHSEDIFRLPRAQANEAMQRRPPTLVWSIREFEHLSPRQQRDLLFAHTLGRFDLDLSSDYPEMTPDDWRRLSYREKRILMQPVRGGMIANPAFAAASLTIATTSYSAGDELGTEVTWTSMATGVGRSGTVLSANVVDYAKVTGAILYYLFTAASSPASDNAANSWADANALTLNGGLVIPFPTPYASALNSYAEVANLGLYYTTTATSSLFGNGVTQIAHTFFGAATDLKYAAQVLYD